MTFWLQWSAARTVCSGRVSLLLVLGNEHGESRVWHVKALRKRKHDVRAGDAQSRQVPDAALWDTNRLHWLEQAVKHQVPEDVPLSKRRNVPDKEVGQHSKRCGEDNPGKRKDGILYLSHILIVKSGIVELEPNQCKILEKTYSTGKCL